MFPITVFPTRVLKTGIATILLAIALNWFGLTRGVAQVDDVVPADREIPTMLKELHNRGDKLSFANLVSRSTIEAEEFRRSLFGNDAEPNRATVISKACVSFRDVINKRAASQRAGQQTDLASYDLSRFQLDHKGIFNSIEGTLEIPEPSQFYGSFEGKWFGIWDRKNVDHHWGEFVLLKPARTYGIASGELVRLLGYQYAWVGDGYGLNHLASSLDGSKNFLLGYAVHIRDGDINREVYRRPHVGVIDGANRLIWITKSEIFFEEMMPGKTKAEDQYFITGFRYSIVGGKLVANDAFQALYSRDPENRKPWQGFKIDLQIEF